MDLDTIFVVGTVITLLAVPAIVSAYVDGRTPRAPAVIIVIGGAMVAYAMSQRPGSYNFETLPDVFVRVVAQFF